jgi:hypothetical protein
MLLIMSQQHTAERLPPARRLRLRDSHPHHLVGHEQLAAGVCLPHPHRLVGVRGRRGPRLQSRIDHRRLPGPESNACQPRKKLMNGINESAEIIARLSFSPCIVNFRSSVQPNALSQAIILCMPA